MSFVVRKMPVPRIEPIVMRIPSRVPSPRERRPEGRSGASLSFTLERLSQSEGGAASERRTERGENPPDVFARAPTVGPERSDAPAPLGELSPRREGTPRASRDRPDRPPSKAEGEMDHARTE